MEFTHFSFIIAAHCIRGTTLVSSGYTADAVRLGEHNLRSEIDCEEVSFRFVRKSVYCCVYELQL